MCESVQYLIADAREQFLEGVTTFNVRVQDDGVDEKPDEPFGLEAIASSARGSDNDAVLICVAM